MYVITKNSLPKPEYICCKGKIERVLFAAAGAAAVAAVWSPKDSQKIPTRKRESLFFV